MSQSPSSDDIAAAFETLRKSNQYLVIPKEDFDTRLSLALSNAHVQRQTEAHIYAVYDLILSNACASIDPIHNPRATVVSNPQAVFGPIAEPYSRAGLSLNNNTSAPIPSPNIAEPKTPESDGGHGGGGAIQVPPHSLHHAGGDAPVRSSVLPDGGAQKNDDLESPVQSEQDSPRTPRNTHSQALPQADNHEQHCQPVEPSDTSAPTGKHRLRGVRIPDFARIILLTPDPSRATSQTGEQKLIESRSLVDFWEIKRFDTDESVSWHSAEGSRLAAHDLEANLLQVYETAMAAFEHHPDLSEVTALLIIGVYFSMLVWERPDATVLDSLLPASVNPGQKGSTSSNAPSTPEPPTLHSLHSTPIQSPSTPRRVPTEPFSKAAKRQKAIQEEILRRPLPKVYYWNERVFNADSDLKHISQVKHSLSSAFLIAMAMPLQRIKVTYQPSWFECEVKQGATSVLEHIEGKERVERKLHQCDTHSEAGKAMEGDLNFYEKSEDGSMNITRRDPVGKTPPTDNRMDLTYRPPRIYAPVSPSPAAQRPSRKTFPSAQGPETMEERDARRKR